jgi:hypothetical protein
VRIGFVVACAMILGLTWFGTSEAAAESQVNCNEVMAEDRCACNDRVLLALTTMRRIVPDPNSFANVGEINTTIAIQQEQRNRLRTYYAPGCESPASPDNLPLAAPHVTGRPYGGWGIDKHLKPLLSEIIDDSTDGKLIVARKLLVGRWEGWQTLFGGKPTPVSFHVISVGTPLTKLQAPSPGRFVKACSDQGMVFGRIRDGYMELPRVDSSGAMYSMRFWKSIAPRSRDLEGVVLLEVRPGETLVAGLVSLSRPPKFDWTGPPSNYFCQDRDLEEQRKNAQDEQRRILPWKEQDWYLHYR